MTRRPRRSRYLALGLEVAGAASACYAVSWWSVPLAILLGGVLLIVGAQFAEGAL